jgi:hypothetical protein
LCTWWRQQPHSGENDAVWPCNELVDCRYFTPPFPSSGRAVSMTVKWPLRPWLEEMRQTTTNIGHDRKERGPTRRHNLQYPPSLGLTSPQQQRLKYGGQRLSFSAAKPKLVQTDKFVLSLTVQLEYRSARDCPEWSLAVPPKTSRPLLLFLMIITNSCYTSLYICSRYSVIKQTNLGRPIKRLGLCAQTGNTTAYEVQDVSWTMKCHAAWRKLR